MKLGFRTNGTYVLGAPLSKRRNWRDYDTLTLSVATGNRQAIHVYRNVGFEPAEDDGGPVGGAIDLEMRLPLDGAVAERVRLPPAER